LIGAMLSQTGATGKAKTALNFAMDSAREGLRAPVKLAPSVWRRCVAEALRVLLNSSVREPADNLGARQ
jgi:hypothetical protein